MAPDAMTQTKNRSLTALAATFALTSCNYVPPPTGSWAAEKEAAVRRINAEIEDPTLRAKALVIERLKHIRAVHAGHGGNPTLLGVKVRAEERRPAGYTEADASLNPLDEVITEDIRIDSDLVFELDTERPAMPAFGAVKEIETVTSFLKVNKDVAATKNAALQAPAIHRATAELDRLRKWITEDLGEVSATIEAFVTPRKGERTRVHVGNYDEIAGSAKTAKITPRKVKLARHLAAEQAKLALAAHKTLQTAVTAFAAGPKGGGKRTPDPKFQAELTGLATAAAALKAVADTAAADQLGALPTGRIALSKQNVKHGDRIEITVVIERIRNNVTTKEQVTFSGRLIQVGIYSKIGGNLIYARADSGPGSAQTWKPNAAASLEWHWRTAYADDPAEKFWNWLDPGIGVHVASLDQIEDQATELGIGVNVSIWDGFLQGGVGYNLNASRDHTYYYFGIDLLSILTSDDDS